MPAEDDKPVVIEQTSEQLLEDCKALLDILNLNVPNEAGALVTNMIKRIEKHVKALRERRVAESEHDKIRQELLEKMMQQQQQQSLISRQTLGGAMAAPPWATLGGKPPEEGEITATNDVETDREDAVDALVAALEEAGVTPEELQEAVGEDKEVAQMLIDKMVPEK